MKIEIKNRLNGSVIFSGDYGSLRECVIDAVRKRADLSGANLSGANLSWVNLSGVNLSGADLSRADLSGVNLSGANLSGVNLSGVKLSGADLSRADLSGADLSGANLFRVNFSGANLSGANLFRANLFRADLSGANLFGAKNVDIYLQFGPVGSRHSFLVYNAKNNIFQTGCFSGTETELLKAVKEKHAKTEHLKPYLLAIKSLKAMAKLKEAQHG